MGVQGTEPTTTNQQDNILFNTNPIPGGYIGWVRTNGAGVERWQQFGPISTENGQESYAFEKLAVGQSTVDTGEVFSVTGDVSFSSLKIDDLTTGRLALVGTSGELQDSASSVSYTHLTLPTIYSV